MFERKYGPLNPQLTEAERHTKKVLDELDRDPIANAAVVDGLQRDLAEPAVITETRLMIECVIPGRPKRQLCAYQVQDGRSFWYVARAGKTEWARARTVEGLRQQLFRMEVPR